MYFLQEEETGYCYQVLAPRRLLQGHHQQAHPQPQWRLQPDNYRLQVKDLGLLQVDNGAQWHPARYDWPKSGSTAQ